MQAQLSIISLIDCKLASHKEILLFQRRAGCRRDRFAAMSLECDGTATNSPWVGERDAPSIE